MNTSTTAMRITIRERAGGPSLRERLTERLASAAALRCIEHDRPVVSVTIFSRENGWFDSQWTACCEELERKAMSIVKSRC